jgi:hypothetical protein
MSYMYQYFEIFHNNQRFGCDNRLNGRVLDECGICGGDNSSCVVMSRTDTIQQKQGEFQVFIFLDHDLNFFFTYLLKFI